jgi:hypothetical protein
MSAWGACISEPTKPWSTTACVLSRSCTNSSRCHHTLPCAIVCRLLCCCCCCNDNCCHVKLPPAARSCACHSGQRVRSQPLANSYQRPPHSSVWHGCRGCCANPVAAADAPSCYQPRAAPATRQLHAADASSSYRCDHMSPCVSV